MAKISSGSNIIDTFLAGGYDNDIITTIFGPSGSGKTNIVLLAACQTASQGKKVIFIDTEGGIAVERIRQISCDYTKILENLLFFNPTTFEEQKNTFSKIKELLSEKIGMIVVDSISMLYRLELGKSDEVYDVNLALGKQIGLLVEIARTRNIPILITNQVYADFDNRDNVKMVGGDLLKYGSKCLLELKSAANSRLLILRKHRSLPEGKEIRFKIVQNGIELVQ